MRRTQQHAQWCDRWPRDAVSSGVVARAISIGPLNVSASLLSIFARVVPELNVLLAALRPLGQVGTVGRAEFADFGYVSDGSGTGRNVTPLLLIAGADVNAFDSSSTLKVMQETVTVGNAHMVSLFLSNNGLIHQPQCAKNDQQDNREWSALVVAVNRNHLPSVQLPLGRTLAHIACFSASRLVVDRLLECGIPIEDCYKNGLYPIQIAILHQNKDALEAVLSRYIF
ncbi:unnamed protein product [Angiostrongylus costaricensis]|uniref:ANK_REP_REGION domain-containing protein n=1 Tax=Angiostrongylus costaricensis TaxID=334426 RepID=A0A0R3PGX1_ANGCS|nr:unnamed protein product [Angiostrongylus costaricensis]